ncbi:MAG TPA: lipopolysaccharide heptosyltransferase II [Gemmatimonadales bacterium]|nr:lipopolysaccharide heptosyltransferase II [Gemmatimonadales bacterium]
MLDASAPNVLAVRFSSIGDVLLTTPLLRAIRRRHPTARITVLTKLVHAPLLSHNPYVNDVIGLPADRGVFGLAAELRRNRFTHLLDLHDSVRSRMLHLLVPGRWRRYPKHRLARAVLIHAKRNWYRDPRQVAERYFDAARDLDVTPDGGPPDLFLSAEAVRETADWMDRIGLRGDRPLLALAPGAAHATKRWPLEHWHALARRLIADGFELIVVGGSEDIRIARAIVANAGDRAVNAAGQFGLQGTGAVLQRVRGLVSGDTGVMHLATAVGTPVVALFGPTVRPFGYFPYTPRAEVVELPLGCRPCSSKGSSRCPLGHHRCLGDMRPELVLEAVRRSVA